MRQYTKHVYVKSTLNFEILGVEIEKHVLRDNFKRCFTEWD